MRILAIDPGYERLGVAIIEKLPAQPGSGKRSKEVVLFSECFRTSAKVSFEERLLSIGARVEELIKEYSPAGLAIENLFLSNNQKTAMRVAEVRGAIIYICRKNALFIQEFTPLQIKLSVTGSGASGKDQVIKMVNLLVTNLNKKALDDEYDAIAAGLAYFALNNPALK